MSPQDLRCSPHLTRAISPGDLAYACYLYESMSKYTKSLATFHRSTKSALDLLAPRHREHLIEFLNAWDGRLPKATHQEIVEGLRRWWADHEGAVTRLDRGGCSLHASDTDLMGLEKVFEALRDVPVPADKPGTRTRLGPTTASKALFALRPGLLLAWDTRIRERLKYDDSGASYVHYHRCARRQMRQLGDACERHGFTLAELPEKLGRPPYTTPEQLIVEYYWITLTRGVALPTKTQMEHWLDWSSTGMT